MPKIFILGAGRVGRVITRDLAGTEGFEIHVVDRRAEVLDRLTGKYNCTTIKENLSNPEVVRKVVSDADMVLGALPGALGFGALSALVAEGKRYIDTSFMAEDAQMLDKTAQKSGATVLYDFGTAPGIANVVVAWSAAKVAPAKEISVMVGGLPQVRTRPWEYTAPFSPEDVLEEYIRPARVRIGGQVMELEALSGVERLEVSKIGTLEAFNTDNLRSLIATQDCPNMVHKTLRYPGHAKRILLLRNAGLLDETPENVKGTLVSPKDLVLAKLQSAWKAEIGTADFTLMIVSVKGLDGREYKWRLFDRSDDGMGESSVARTTAYPTALAARLMLDGTIDLKPGVHPPEVLADKEIVIDRLRQGLLDRGVEFRREE